MNNDFNWAIALDDAAKETLINKQVRIDVFLPLEGRHLIAGEKIDIIVGDEMIELVVTEVSYRVDNIPESPTCMVVALAFSRIIKSPQILGSAGRKH